jgi:hypothetical protein
MKYDIVIPYRENKSQELAYCYKSIVKNLPYNSIHIIGEGLTGVDWKRHPWVNRPSAQMNVESKIVQACEELITTDHFYLFNDDFFVLEKIDRVPTKYRETLKESIDKRKYYDTYTISLINTYEYLRANGIDEPISYELHMPMLFNTKKRLEYFDKTKQIWRRKDLLMRSVYGNLEGIGGEYMADVKNPTNYKDKIFLSTSDNSFKDDDIGKHIREKIG